MLRKDPKERPSALMCLNHEWFELDAQTQWMTPPLLSLQMVQSEEEESSPSPEAEAPVLGIRPQHSIVSMLNLAQGNLKTMTSLKKQGEVCSS